MLRITPGASPEAEGLIGRHEGASLDPQLQWGVYFLMGYGPCETPPVVTYGCAAISAGKQHGVQQVPIF